jgi:protein-L-isoaspartate(D-aspartate) O-methyltransferase
MKDIYLEERKRLLTVIAGEVANTSQFVGRSYLDPATHAALMAVPRHEFVPPELRDKAYENRPLPIGLDQTISQPYIVAIMTDMLRLSPDSRVLEIGTGCGYQAAVLSKIASRVITLERIGALADSARARLAELNYENVTVLHADGAKGWQVEAPYDGIIVTAAAKKTPSLLLDQLRPGGRLVVPVGRHGWTQSLIVFKKNRKGDVSESCHLPVAFVPLLRNIQA